MVSFNTSGLKSSTASNYTLEEFNGVDYTTTPTKVSDDKAIKISNYLPEGNSLVKRYGYTKIMDFIYDNVADIAAPITYGGNTYTIEQSLVSMRLIQFKDFLILFFGRSVSTKIINYVVFLNENSNGELQVRSKLKLEQSNTNPMSVIFGYKCDTGAINIVNNVIYAFVFGDYLCIEYKDSKFYVNRLRMKNKESHYVIINGVQSQIEAAYMNGTFATGYVESGTTFNVDATNNIEPYVPTLALNYQPENGLGKSIIFEQLNLLSRKFKVEFGITLKLTKSGDTITAVDVVNPKYDLKNIVDVGFNYPAPVYEHSTLLLVENMSDTSGYEISASLSNGIISFSTSAASYQDGTTGQVYQTKIPMEILQDDYRYVKLTYEFELSFFNMDDIMTAKVGCVYGINNSADRIFVGNTDKAPNTDWHTLNDANGNPNFTYIGTDTYNAIGSSGSEIIGYSLLNDGSMAIFKDPNDISNIFIRTGKISTTTEEYSTYNYATSSNITYSYVKSEELYPTIASGLLIKSITKDTKFCLYDNKLIFNTEDGVYYLNLNSTTANQSYSAKELSYYIRGDLGKNISNSTIFTDGKYLYVAREDKKGQLRVYVADKNKYGFVNSEEQYHWWVLDNYPVKEFFAFNKNVYFLNNDFSVYKITDNTFTDCDYKTSSSATIGTTVIATDVAFDTDTDKMIIATGSPSWQKLLDIYKYNANIDKDNIGEKLEYIKKNVSLSLSSSGGDIYIIASTIFYYPSISNNELVIRVNEQLSTAQKEKDFIAALKGTEIKYAKINNNDMTQLLVYRATVEDINRSYYENDYTIVYVLNLSSIEASTIYGNATLEMSGNNLSKIYINISNKNLKFKELYTSDGKALSDYFYIPNSGWYNATTGDFVSETLDFNMANFTLNGLAVNFDTPSTNIVAGVNFIIQAPVEAYWYGKFTDLGRYDILKTTKSIHFVPETRRGGYTQVGYRTRKSKTMNADTTSTYTLSKYIIDIAKERTTLSRYFVSNDLGINLSDVDFNNFSFESDVFARTYSSKKKIKNFSFIQLKFNSDTAEDSTIASVDIKFTYTKDNKGVK